jgi:hypothetical protein
MGAHSIEVSWDGSLTENQVRKKFEIPTADSHGWGDLAPESVASGSDPSHWSRKSPMSNATDITISAGAARLPISGTSRRGDSPHRA